MTTLAHHGLAPIGTDPRRVRHPAAPGSHDLTAAGRSPRVAVVGAGIAGLAAATGLAERGVTVELIERERYLGGRVGGWSLRLDDGGTVAMNRGFHAFFRQYYNLRKLLSRGDPGLRRLRPVEDYPLIDAAGRRDTFRHLPRTPPWNALAFALRSPTFRLRDLARIDARAAAPLAAVSVPGIYARLDDCDAETFLRRIRFPDAARHLAFEVFSRSFFAHPRQMSAAELAAMFHIYFLGSSEGLLFDVADDNFDTALWEPLREHLTGPPTPDRPGGVTVHTGVTVAGIDRHETRGFRLHDTTGATLDADGVVLAADVPGLRAIVARSPSLGDPTWRSRVAELATAPPFLVHRLWLDRPVRAERAAFVATGGLSPVDNISVLDRYEEQAARWARRHGGSVVELHAYAVTDAAPSAALRARMLARLHALYPETARARIVGEATVWKQDCPRFAPGDFARRPGVRTPDPHLVLAGDGIRIDLPVALMERAATTGWTAANVLLSRWGAAGHPLQTVPTEGRSRVLRTFANRRRQS
ncbi:FAD-dependent oxidoreductase [Nocardia blacklockiae]|uniref:FAD-dependent oxidoreductase n=1 Tax=Nocardia blacklockiae TaxID=480036 RepID=UPI0018931EDE|nr:FAD-dependent oxidoreductase [Nocardia blacklockiae]MBF6170959.1 FAD-dependent oxidoreductase [Nocardia blacklockiae]